MNLTFDEIHAGAMKRMPVRQRALLFLHGVKSREVVKAMLLEASWEDLNIEDRSFSQIDSFHERTANRFVSMRCAKYGAPKGFVILTTILLAALGALVECVVMWLWDKFVNKQSLQAAVPELNQLGRAA